MPQTLFALVAILILGLFSLQANRTTFSNEQRMILNEVATQATGVGIEILEEIGTYAYDPAASGGNVLQDAEKHLLKPKAEFGNGACDPDADFAGCLVINDFDGTRATRDLDEFTYEVEIEVNYVNEMDPAVISGTPTFSKRVDLTITGPLLYVGSPNNPLTFRMSRVYTHPSVTG